MRSFFLLPENRFKILVAFSAVLVGMLVRYPYLTSKDAFPFGDGGLFVEMIYAIKFNNYLLPSFVNYNGYQIPFAYPPLGFYLALISSKVFGLSILQSTQILPVILNVFTIVVFSLLAAELTKDKVELFLASVIFSIILQAYMWTVKGGGLSRSPGFLFSILALYFFFLYQKTRTRLPLVFSAIAFGFSAASHLEWALITAASLLVFVFFFGVYKSKSGIYNLIIFGMISVFITSPWWGLVVYRFGITPFASAWNVAEMDIHQFFEKFLAGSIFRITIFSSKDYFLPILGVIGFISSFFYRERSFLSIWLLTTYFVAPKNSPISGLLPLVLLIAIGLRILDKGLLFIIAKTKIVFPENFQPYISIPYLLIVLFLSVPQLMNKPIVQRISTLERTAMEYVKENTESGASFVVLTANDWHSADAAEWFPYLTQRQSMTTPQGLEWLSVAEFNGIVERVAMLSRMVRNEQTGAETNQLAAYVESNFADYGYVAVFSKNIDKDFGGFMATGNYEVFYRKNDVLILRWVK